jgi:group II intron reverse transcriptase/maturase
MGLTTPATVQKLQAALHAKAKCSPDFRFYSLYDKVHRPDVLAFAYRCCKANQGCAGIDGQTFADIEAYGPERWLGELMEALRNKTYRPQPLRREYILKADGKSKRPLGIPTIRDRVAQTAAALVLGPTFEADLMPEQYAYRPGRRALDAVQHVERLIRTGHQEVVDADLSGFFDTIPHADLMRSVARRTCDSSLLHLVKMWLEMPVVEPDRGSGTGQTSTRNREEGIGTPQGSPISPLLSNLYMRRFIRGWQILGYQAKYGAQIVNYADDFVICCRRHAAEAMAGMRWMMTRLKLTVNEAKTHLRKLPDETFDFLGYTFGRRYSPQTGQSYLGAGVSKKKVQKVIRTLHDLTTARTCSLDARKQVGKLNLVLNGWANYFRYGTKAKAYNTVNQYVRLRLHRWLCRKHKVRNTGWTQFTDQMMYRNLGLVRLGTKRYRVACAKA